MKILLPLDGSECSESTIDWVIHTLNKQDVQYSLLYVLETIPEEALLIESEKAQAFSVLQRDKEKLEQAGCTVLSAECLQGNTVPTICDYATKIGAEQMIVGSHGRKGLSKLLLGSVSMQVLEKCHCPVTIHHEEDQRPAH